MISIFAFSLKSKDLIQKKPQHCRGKKVTLLSLIPLVVWTDHQFCHHGHQIGGALLPYHLGEETRFFQSLQAKTAQVSEEQCEIVLDLQTGFGKNLNLVLEQLLNLLDVLVVPKVGDEILHAFEAAGGLLVIAVGAKLPEVVQAEHQVREFPQGVYAESEVVLGGVQQLYVLAHLVDKCLTLNCLRFDRLDL